MKLFESEQHVMEVIWEEGEVPAKEIVKVLKERIGWNKNTTYTVIKKCIEKNAIQRTEPGFMCKPLIAREEFQSYELNKLITKTFNGSKSQFLSAFFEENLSEKEIAEIEAMIHKKVK